MSLGGTYFATVRREPNLVGYWRLNESGTSTVAKDSGPFGLNGLYTGAAIGVALIQNDPAASSMWLNGIAGRNAQIPDISALDLTGDLSLETWVLPQLTPQTSFLIAKGTASTSTVNPYGLLLNAGVPTFRVGNGTITTAVAALSALPISQPTHIVATLFRTAMSLYINGALVNTGTAGALTDNAQPVYLGAFGNNSPLVGLLGECAIYNGALSATRVARHFNLGQSIFPDQAHYTSVDAPSYA